MENFTDYMELTIYKVVCQECGNSVDHDGGTFLFNEELNKDGWGIVRGNEKDGSYIVCPDCK